jgi:hypothetical protein
MFAAPGTLLAVQMFVPVVPQFHHRGHVSRRLDTLLTKSSHKSETSVKEFLTKTSLLRSLVFSRHE